MLPVVLVCESHVKTQLYHIIQVPNELYLFGYVQLGYAGYQDNVAIVFRHSCKYQCQDNFPVYMSVTEQYKQSTLVISNSKGLSEIFRDIRTSTYQICRIEENIIRTTTFNKYICNLTLEVRDILKILWKRGEIAP